MTFVFLFQIIITEYMLENQTDFIETTSLAYYGIYNYATRTCEFFASDSEALYYICTIHSDFDFMKCLTLRNTLPDPCGTTYYYKETEINADVFSEDII